VKFSTESHEALVSPEIFRKMTVDRGAHLFDGHLLALSCARSDLGLGWLVSWVQRMPSFAYTYLTFDGFLQGFLNLVCAWPSSTLSANEARKPITNRRTHAQNVGMAKSGCDTILART